MKRLTKFLGITFVIGTVSLYVGMNTFDLLPSIGGFLTMLFSFMGIMKVEAGV